MKNRFFVALFLAICALLLTAAGPYSVEYQPLAGLDIHQNNRANLEVLYKQSTFNINLGSLSQDNDPTELSKLNDEVVYATYQVFKFADMHSLPIRNCRDNNQLDVYLIEYAVLNDASRFNQWKQFAPEATEIRALYDPIPESYKVSAIMLTKQSSTEMPHIIAHEVSHYWFDRFCWERSWTQGNTEHFARQFESYYRSIR